LHDLVDQLLHPKEGLEVDAVGRPLNRCTVDCRDGSHGGTWTATTVPEPSTVVLLALGLIVMGVAAKRESSRRVILLMFLAVLALAPAAAADTIYSYVGDTFRTVSGVYTLADRITGSFTVQDGFTPQPLPGGSNWLPGVLSYRFTDGHQILTNANSTAGIRLTLGLPFFWDVEVAGLGGHLSIYDEYDRVDEAVLGPSLLGPDVARNQCTTYCDGSHTGTWIVSTPEPSTLALLAAGLVVLSASLWRGRARG
jgi:hypothetical protein